MSERHTGAARRAGIAGSSATIGFNGPSVTWVTSKGPDRGIARVAVDGIVQGDVDLYNPTVIWDVPLTFDDFPSGAHCITTGVGGPESRAKRHVALDEQGRVLGHEVKVPVDVHHSSTRCHGDRGDQEIGVRNGQAPRAQLTSKPRGLRPSLFGRRQDRDRI